MNKIMTKEEWGASAAEAFGAAVKSAYEDMIDAAVAAEREACLAIADQCADADMHASMAANAIRARGVK